MRTRQTCSRHLTVPAMLPPLRRRRRFYWRRNVRKVRGFVAADTCTAGSPCLGCTFCTLAAPQALCVYTVPMDIADITADLSRRVKEQRFRLNLSQREAADYLGVSVRTLQTWEAGETFPRAKHRRALERFLRAETVELEETA